MKIKKSYAIKLKYHGKLLKGCNGKLLTITEIASHKNCPLTRKQIENKYINSGKVKHIDDDFFIINKRKAIKIKYVGTKYPSLRNKDVTINDIAKTSGELAATIRKRWIRDGRRKKVNDTIFLSRINHLGPKNPRTVKKEDIEKQRQKEVLNSIPGLGTWERDNLM